MLTRPSYPEPRAICSASDSNVKSKVVTDAPLPIHVLNASRMEEEDLGNTRCMPTNAKATRTTVNPTITARYFIWLARRANRRARALPELFLSFSQA